MRLLLFLGAGFSVEAGLPTQGNFFEHALKEYENNKLDNHLFSGVSAAQMMYESIQGRTDRDPTLEEAFGLLDYIYYMKNDQYKLGYIHNKSWIPSRDSPLTVGETRRLFLKAIEKMFKYKWAGKKYFEHELYETFFKTLFDNYEIAIITTNYDLVCESILDRFPHHKGHIFPVINKLYGYSALDGTPLLKLHGSVDWIETPFDAPNIIPPTWSKQFDRTGKYNRIWNSAEDAITFSDTIMFIGYSMTQADTHIKNLIRMGLARAIDFNNEKHIIVVKPSWNKNDQKNYEFLTPEIQYNVKKFDKITKGFKEFSKSDFINKIES